MARRHYKTGAVKIWVQNNQESAARTNLQADEQQRRSKAT